MRLALFVSCLVDTLFPRAGIATVALLERLGHSVSFPAEQTCCGQMHANSGYEREAVALMRRFVHCFSEVDAEAIVAPSASCAAMVRHHYPRLARASGERELAERAQALAARTFELSELLVHHLGVADVGASFPHRVAYHPSCHGLRLLRLGRAPLALLEAVRGLRLVQLPDAQTCCGFGGAFAVKELDVSAAMLADKVHAVTDSGAEVLCAVDCSCLMHIGGALSRRRAGVSVMHLAEILAGGAQVRQ